MFVADDVERAVRRAKLAEDGHFADPSNSGSGGAAEASDPFRSARASFV